MSGTMSGGGGKPRGGRMGTSIRATGVSGEAVANAENELSKIVDLLSNIREKIDNAVRHIELQRTKSLAWRWKWQKAKERLKVSIKHLASLETASQPKTDEIDNLKELKKIISKEEKEIEKLEKGSK